MGGSRWGLGSTLSPGEGQGLGRGGDQRGPACAPPRGPGPSLCARDLSDHPLPPIHRPQMGASICLGWQWALVALRLWSHRPSPAPSSPPSSMSPHRQPPPPGLFEGRVEAGGPAGASGRRQSSPFPPLTPLGRCPGGEAELSRWGRLAAGGSPATLSLSQGNYRRGGNGRG